MDRADPVDGELPHVVGAVVACRQPAAVDAHRVDQAFGGGAVVVDVADQHGTPRLDGVAQRSQVTRSGSGWLRRWPCHVLKRLSPARTAVTTCARRASEAGVAV